ncbi:MAG: MFS transporter, partial [Actinomycetota bacterium]|nr:MFS transporter [Actinomycetota bacterium]
FDPAGATAREAMIPEMAASSGWGLERMNGVHEAAWGVAYLLGPGLGGLLIALTGAAGALWATGVGFMLSGVLVGLVRLGGIDKPEQIDRPENLWRGTLEGIGLVWNDRALRAMLFVMMALVAIYMPVEGVFLPVIFEAEQAPQRLGIVLMAMSGGGVAGSLLYGAYGSRFSRRRAFVYAVVTACIAVAGMSLLPPYPLLVLAAIAGGFFFGPVGPLLNIAMQTRTAPSRRGRVLGVMLSAQYAAGPVGFLVAGPAVEWLGVHNAFMLFGGALLLTGLVTPLLPALVELDRPGAYEAELGLSDMRPPTSERVG